MAYAGTGCPILTENGCYDITVNLKTTAGICLGNCPLPFCVLDLELKQGQPRHDAKVAVLWYAGKKTWEIAEQLGFKVRTVKRLLAQWQETEKEMLGVT